jgi:putative endonuclease
MESCEARCPKGNGPQRNIYDFLISTIYDGTMYFVYILLSQKDHRTYVGYGNDVMVRLKRHNAGHVAATKSRRPLKVLFYEKFETEKEAKERELWWKSSAGRNRLKSIFKERGF